MSRASELVSVASKFRQSEKVLLGFGILEKLNGDLE